MIHYVMVISIMLTPVGPSDWKYIGHFVNCTQAHQHMKLHYPEATGSRCLDRKSSCREIVNDSEGCGNRQNT